MSGAQPDSRYLAQAQQEAQQWALEAGARQKPKAKAKEEPATELGARKRKRPEVPGGLGGVQDDGGIISVLCPPISRSIIVMSASKVTLFVPPTSATESFFDAEACPVLLPNFRLRNRFLAAAPCGRYLVSNGLADSFRVIRIAGMHVGWLPEVKAVCNFNSKTLDKPFARHRCTSEAVVNCATWSPDSSFFATGDSRRGVKLWRKAVIQDLPMPPLSPRIRVKKEPRDEDDGEVKVKQEPRDEGEQEEIKVKREPRDEDDEDEGEEEIEFEGKPEQFRVERVHPLHDENPEYSMDVLEWHPSDPGTIVGGGGKMVLSPLHTFTHPTPHSVRDLISCAPPLGAHVRCESHCAQDEL
jgi:hypothetical protein